MPDMLKKLKSELRELADTERAKASLRFFKTGPGEYGEGDKFLGLNVPDLRRLSKSFKLLSNDDTLQLLSSEFHEERLLSLFILLLKFKQGSPSDQKEIYELYMKNVGYVNNWDLVDCSAPDIVGAYLVDKSKDPLYKFAVSNSLWERRIAVLSTLYYIKRGSFDETLKIADILLKDKEDLIHKAVGWMLREVGNRDISAEKAFLNKCYNSMPRTMLRYAIEKYPEPERKEYLAGTIT